MKALSLYLAFFTLPPAKVDPTAPAAVEDGAASPLPEQRSAHFPATDPRNALEQFAELYPDCTLEQLFAEAWRAGDPLPDPEPEELEPATSSAAPAEASSGSLLDGQQLETAPAFQLEDGGQAGAAAEPLEEGEGQEFELLTTSSRGKASQLETIRAVDLAAAIGQARARGASMIRQAGTVLYTQAGGITAAGALG